ncbi:DNA primase [Mycoplasma sp. 2248]|uniref:DNA primase n=1 Tax=Mycoplasma sp. 2248 TaxID=3108528 RepID=UPI002B1DBE1F|nr:DNA primase [Mycoplasma sp. 2248]MEA4190877.1 DNA primase [Mycoplasma sp. 2248]
MSARLTSEITNQIKHENDIVDVISEFIQLHKKGNSYVGLCPFHQDTKPSLSVVQTKQIFKCFVCETAGDVIEFVKRYKSISYVDTLEYLAKRANIELDFEQYKQTETINYSQEAIEITDVLDIVNSFYKVQYLTNQAAKEYLAKRKIDNQIREKFNIGYAPKNVLVNYLTNLNYSTHQMQQAGLVNADMHELFWDRVTFGIANEHGHIVGFSGRKLNNNDPNSPKYINSPETAAFNKSRILYNYHNAKDSIRTKKQVVIVEGYMDVIACYKAGIENVVAIMGTALTKEHLALIKNTKVLMFLDNDKAGIEATFRSLSRLLEHNFDVSIINNTYSKDPDEILNEYGAQTLVDLINNSQISAIDFLYNRLKIKHQISSDNYDFNHFNLFIIELNKYLDLFSEKEQQYLKSQLQREFNYELKIVPKRQIQEQVKYDEFVANDPYAPIDPYDGFVQALNNVRFDEKDFYSKLTTLGIQNRLKILTQAMMNPHILDILKQTEHIGAVFSYPTQIGKLYKEVIKNTAQYLNENYLDIFKQYLLKNCGMTEAEVNSEIIENYLHELYEETTFFTETSILSFNSYIVEQEPFIQQTIADLPKGDALPPYLVDTINNLKKLNSNKPDKKRGR